MDITSVRAWIVAASLLSVCAVSQAAGLGKLNVRSALGEPFKAEVELVAEKSEMGSLSVRMANREAFERAGLAYTGLLAGIKASVEKRSSGEPYVLLTSSQPVNEPFVDLLLELTWSSGRLSREFTALLDPPSVIAEREKQKAAAPQVRAAPTTPAPRAEPVPPPAEAPPTEEAPAATSATPQEPTATEPAATESAATEPAATEPAATEPVAPSPAAETPTAPVETIGGSQPTLLGEGGDEQYPAGVDAYGPVKSGDTLTKIAIANKPADVSLEQMLVLLVRGNPDAFSGKNMNRLKTGKILQLPSAEQLASVNQADARTEVRLQARNWRAYKEQLAAAAGEMTPGEEPAQQAASGKIGSTVQEGATGAEPPQEVLKLSKNAPQAGAPAGDAQSAARVRALEEEVVARDKAVKEADTRVARLEKQIGDLQALLAMKSKGTAEPQGAAPVAPAPPVTPQAEIKAPAPAPPATPEAPAPTPKSEAPAPAQPAPVPPKAPVVRTAPLPPEPSLIDQFLEQPAYIGAAIGVLIIIGALAVRGVRRRRESKSDAEESGPAGAFAETPALAYGALAGTGKGDDSYESARESSDEVDPIAEAEIFLAYGRDAQAEELLKEALETSPRSNEIRLKLLQIYANRKDAKAFEQVARELQQGTGGTGPLWDQAVALGYQVDPANARYAEGAAASGAAATAASAAAASAAAEDVDFNIGTEDATAITATDIDLGDAASAVDRTQIIDPAEFAQDTTQSFQSTAAPAMDFNVDLPAVEPASSDAGVQQTSGSSGLDFDIDLNTLTSSPAAGAKPDTGGLDFDMSGLSLDTSSAPRAEHSAAAPEIDLSGISLDLGTETSPTAPTDKDDHWYDVQTKFDLAKAYQEMGDKDGAREILKEVLAEGDSEQKTAAQSVLTTLDS